MDSPERGGRVYVKREVEDGSDVKSDRAGEDEDEEWEGSDKIKHRSSRSRKSSGNGDDVDGGGSGRRRSHGDRSESRKRSGGSSNADSDEEDYDLRKESRSKMMKKKQEESSLEKLSSWYEDGEFDNRQDGGDKSGGRGAVRGEDVERRKLASKLAQHETSQSKSKSKESHDGENDKTVDRDSKYSDRKESTREKTHGSSEQVRTSRRKWDDTEGSKKAEETYNVRSDSRSSKPSDPKYEPLKEKTLPAKNEPSDNRIKVLDSSSERGSKSNNKEERKGDAEKSKSKSRGELEEDNRDSPVTREDRYGKEKAEKHREPRTPTGRDATEGRERMSNADDDTSAEMKDKGAREFGTTTRSRTPERTGRRHQESEDFDGDYDRSFNLKRKELEKDGYRDDRSKGRDDNYGDKNRDREVSKENWKRRQPSNSDKDPKSGDINYDNGREWGLPRHSRDRGDNERPHGRAGNRKDGNRGEAVKTSSNFGISNENYDVIEIQTKPDYGRAEMGSNFSRRNEVNRQSDGASAPNDEEWTGKTDTYGSGTPREDSKDRFTDDTVSRDSWKDDFDSHGGKGRGQRGSMPSRSAGGQSSSGGSQPPYGNAEQGSFNRNASQGVKGGRGGRGGRGRPTGRDNQQMTIPIPMVGSPFGPIGMPPPGPMQPLNPSMSPAPGPPMFPISPPVWPGARGVDISMLSIPPALAHGSAGPRFPSNMVTPTNPSMFFGQAGPGRGVPPSIASPGFNPTGPMGRGATADKNQGGWVPHKSSGPPGKAPSRGEQNDYSQNFVDTGMRPQNFIRELELTNVVEDYPKLRELIQKKDEIVEKAASNPMYYRCDLKEFELTPEFFGTKFDVILVDPPWEEYVHCAPGVADHTECWTFEEIMNLKIEAIADTPSFIFLWVGDGMGLEQGRQCLKKWGFRRCEDICWVKTNKNNPTPGLRHDSHTLFQHSKEHCLMGIKGTVRRSTDGHIIHANIDTDVIIAEEPPYGSTQKPDDMYRIIEHFALGRRRLELFGEDHNIRAGWLTVGKELSSSNFNAEAYIRNFADKDGKVWQGGGGRNPPPEAPHLVVTTPDIEALRPKSPMKNQQQLQHQQSASISLTSANSSNRRPGNSPQNPTGFSMNQEASGSNPSTPVPWGSSPMEGYKGRDGSIMPSDDKVFDMYGYGGQPNGDYVGFEAHRHMNLM